jgi:hypothetical protein
MNVVRFPRAKRRRFRKLPFCRKPWPCECTDTGLARPAFLFAETIPAFGVASPSPAAVKPPRKRRLKAELIAFPPPTRPRNRGPD